MYYRNVCLFAVGFDTEHDSVWKHRMTDVNSSKVCQPSHPEGAKAPLLVFVGLVTVWLYTQDKDCVGRKAKPKERSAIHLCNSIISQFFY